MRICDLTLVQASARLAGDGLYWGVGPFIVRLKSRLPDFNHTFYRLYAHHRLLEPDFGGVSDFHIDLHPSRGMRRFWHPQVFFALDGPTGLAPFPLDHAVPLFEWGFNYAIARRANQYLLLHAAVVARGDRAMVLPALPGSGKSTLCAALVARGWRLLSDEFAAIRPATGLIHPIPRPIALKNASIAIIRAFHPEAIIGPTFPKTRKGNVAHMQPPAASVQAEEEPARPVWVVSPKYQPDLKRPVLDPMSQDHGFMRLAGHSFNYELLGARGFATATALARACRCFELGFADLEAAVALLDGLAAADAGAA
ncbi:MAG: HprK-related kinase A [Magnetococcales bacterium]|nr:HprK-related kinase A [Magnetococcales bacterium]NGZ07150.1 HprK-related kinase A [Magnetococcales bacterium]